tara:strand:- start:96 stop:599 length:504 start_codon:yes stop_codon:yes gene_type:complete
MSLINGMDDIMTHIKNQEIRIKKLEEENAKLKTFVSTIKSTIKYEEPKYEKPKCINYEEWKNEWMEENIDILSLGNRAEKISDFQDQMEEDMVFYFNDNKDDMNETLKTEWLKVFMECDDDFVENCDDPGVLYDNIREYFIHSLDADEDDISNWENDVDGDSDSDSE